MIEGYYRKSSGFTLIELLVVIAIIGVLSVVVLVVLSTTRDKSRDARRVSDIKQVQNALQLYFDATVGNDGAGANTGTSYPLDIYTAGVLAPTYIPTVPRDPSGSNYFYAPFTTTGAIVVCSGTTACQYYQLGAALVGTTHVGLSSDRDLFSGVSTPPVGTPFEGLSAACTDTEASPDGCYDVTP